MSYISGIQEETIVDGLGIRFSVYWSGCTHFCPGCHNPETHNFKNGDRYEDKVDEIIEKIRNNINVLDGVTLSGGDPLNIDNVIDVADFIKRIKDNFPKLNIWCYTGYTYEELMEKKDTSKYVHEFNYILSNINVLVDGRFVEELKDLTLSFRGSSNQRIIDLKETFKNGRISLLELDV